MLYKVKIKEEGLYMPMMIKKLSLMKEVEDAVHIPAMVESLMFCEGTILVTTHKPEYR